MNCWKIKGINNNVILFISVVILLAFPLYYKSAEGKVLLFIDSLTVAVCLLPIIIQRIRKTRERRRYILSGIDTVDKMSGEEFERFLAAHFEKLGYGVKTTPKSGDYGADLVMKKGGEKIVLQAKRYTGNIGVAAVQQIVGAKGYYGAQKAIAVTNRYFTKNAIELANKDDVELWDRNRLKEVMLHNKNSGSERIEMGKENYCPLCGSVLVIRKGKHGAFYGCSAYPECHYTRKI